MNKIRKLKLKLSATIGIAILVGMVAVLGGVRAFQSYNNAPKVVIENGNYIEAQSPIASEDLNLSAISSPDFPTNWIRYGGVEHMAGSMEMNTATTTICAIQSPDATSTLQFASAAFTTASTTASIVTVAKAETAFATTTAISYQVTIPANGQGEIVASSTYGGQSSFIFGPEDWLVVGMQGGTGTMSPVGECKAEWIVLEN